MNMLDRLILSAAMLGSLVGALDYTRPQWMTRMGLDWWTLAELHERTQEYGEQAVGLELRLESLQQRRCHRKQILHDLIGGRINLKEAAGRFETLYQDVPESEQYWLQAFPGKCKEKSLYLQIIYCVRVLLKTEAPARAQEISARLEKEFRDVFPGPELDVFPLSSWSAEEDRQEHKPRSSVRLR